MKKRSRPRLKGRPKNLAEDRFLEVSGDQLGAALKAAGLTLQATSDRLGVLGTPVSFPVLSRLISGANKRTRESILGNIATLTPGISREWLSGEIDEELDEALENERMNELEPTSRLAVPVTLTYIVERQRLADEIQEASSRDGQATLDWWSVVSMALSLSHARAQWRGHLYSKSRVPVREFNDFVTAAARSLRLKLGPWLAGIERLAPPEIAQRHAEFTKQLVSCDSGGGSLLDDLPQSPAG